MLMKRATYLFSALALSLIIACPPARACLTFCFERDDAIIYGRNFDWPVGLGAVFVNVRHVQKFGFVRPPDKPMSWVST